MNFNIKKGAEQPTPKPVPKNPNASKIGYFEAEEGYDVMKSLNDFGQQNNVFATQTGFAEAKGKFYAFVWYK